jgi:hypothetical protein
LTGGASAWDIASEAITKTWDGTRPWNPNEFELIVHLKGCAESILSNIRTKKEKKLMINTPQMEDESDGLEYLERKKGIKEAGEIPNSTIDADVEAATNIILEVLSENPQLERLYDLLMEGKAPREIADELNLSRTEIYNLRRTLERRIKEKKGSVRHEK